MAPLPDGARQVTSIPVRRVNARASVAAFLSFVFPGLGQAYNGQSGLAWALALPAAMIAIGVGLVLLLAGSGILSRLFDIPFLVGLIVLNLALLAWRLVAILQAHLQLEPLSLRRWTGWMTAVLVTVTLGMHGLPTYWVAKAIDTINTVSGPSGRDPISGPHSSALPQPSDNPDVAQGERVNILLVGVDSAPNRTTELTDTMMVISLDPVGRKSAIISVPRDLYGVPLPDGRVFNAKLNSLMAYAGGRPDEFPLGGVGTLKATIGDLLGVNIHYFAAVSLVGFMQAINAVGGVDVTVERGISDPTYVNVEGKRIGFYLQPGTYHMDSELALAYVRSRKGIGDNDFTRADRQQQLLEALRAKLTAGNLVLALPGLLDAVKNTVATDVPSNRMPDLAQAVQDADMSNVRRIVLQPPDYMTAEPFSAAGYILHPNLEAIRAIGEQLLGAPSSSPPESTDPS
jgi:LCP family protein required for cell wall assembly